MSPPTAIVTGGSSGIGLALARYLSSLQWNVVIADLNEPLEPVTGTQFVQTDISLWEDQYRLFQHAYAWGGRLDFCALNAGTDDRDDIFGTLSHDEHNPPKEPNVKLVDVNITGTYYGLKLAAHYMTLDSTNAGKTKTGGKIVVTSSGGGIYPLPALPLYTGSKHALVGLVRALADGKATTANVRINAVCPAIVDTKGLPPGLVAALGPEQMTPMSTIMRCFEELANLKHVNEEGWVQRGHTGQVLEGNVEQLVWHQAPARPVAEGISQLDRKRAAGVVMQAFEKKRQQNLEELA